MQVPSVQDVWHQRAGGFVARLAPVLEWAQQTRGYVPCPDAVLAAASWHGVAGIAFYRRLPSAFSDIPGGPILYGLPVALPEGLRTYLYELPGYDRTLSWDRQTSDSPENHHAYNLMTARATLLTVFQ